MPYTSLNDIKFIVIDIDDTLVIPNDKEYYRSFGKFIDDCVMKVLGINNEQFQKIVEYYKTRNNYAEKILLEKWLVTTILTDLEIPTDKINWNKYDNAYYYLRQQCLEKSPIEIFQIDYEVISLLEYFKSLDIFVIALSNCPEELSRQTLNICGINPDKHFDVYHPWLKGCYAPPKLNHGKNIFRMLAEEYGFKLANGMSIGDNLYMDILPAESLGMMTCHIKSTPITTSLSLTHVTKIKDVFESWYRK
jgi:FMN phosphatase YigB (HAD superfamily)